MSFFRSNEQLPLVPGVGCGFQKCGHKNLCFQTFFFFLLTCCVIALIKYCDLQALHLNLDWFFHGIIKI